MRKIALTLALAALALATAGCQKLQSRDSLNKGVNAFKNAQYPEAVELFKKAVELDPSFASARLYLATAYMQQYVPGADTPENNQMAQAARAQFNEVLKLEAGNSVALASLASLCLNEKKWEEARQWNNKLIGVEPKNNQAYYSLGFIAWSEWYPTYTATRSELKMGADDAGPFKDAKIREDLKARFGKTIDDGLVALDKCLEIDPQYDDAMTFKNLLIRERADLSDSKDEYAKEVATADSWISKALEVKKTKAEAKNKKTGGGITMSEEK
jgi:tetratricopeptide (TPR) repeat protein